MLVVLREMEKFIEIFLIIEYCLNVEMLSKYLDKICIIMLIFILKLIDRKKLYSIIGEIILLFINKEKNVWLLN